MPYIDVRILEKEFNAKVREELKRLGEKVAIMPMVRQYVASLASIHDKVRAVLQSSIEKWESAVSGAVEAFKSDHPTEQRSRLAAARIPATGGESLIHLYPLERQIEYRRDLAKRNRELTSLAHRYVTNESYEL